MSVAGPSLDLLFALAVLAGFAVGASDGGVAAGVLRAARIGRAWLAGPCVAALATSVLILTPPETQSLLADPVAGLISRDDSVVWVIAAGLAVVGLAALAGIAVPAVWTVGLTLAVLGLQGAVLDDAQTVDWAPLGLGLGVAAAAAIIAGTLALLAGRPDLSRARPSGLRAVLALALAGGASVLGLAAAIGTGWMIAAGVAGLTGFWLAWFGAERSVQSRRAGTIAARAAVLVAAAFALIGCGLGVVVLTGALTALTPLPVTAVWPTLSLGAALGLLVGAGVGGIPVARRLARITDGTGAAGAVFAGAAALLAVAGAIALAATPAAAAAVPLVLLVAPGAKRGSAAIMVLGMVLALAIAIAAAFALPMA